MQPLFFGQYIVALRQDCKLLHCIVQSAFFGQCIIAFSHILRELHLIVNGVSGSGIGKFIPEHIKKSSPEHDNVPNPATDDHLIDVSRHDPYESHIILHCAVTGQSITASLHASFALHLMLQSALDGQYILALAHEDASSHVIVHAEPSMQVTFFT